MIKTKRKELILEAEEGSKEEGQHQDLKKDQAIRRMIKTQTLEETLEEVEEIVGEHQMERALMCSLVHVFPTTK